MKAKIIKIIDSKTVKAITTTYKMHSRYGKFVTISKSFVVDTNGKNVLIGQDVEIVSSKPISKKKKWIIR